MDKDKDLDDPGAPEDLSGSDASPEAQPEESNEEAAEVAESVWAAAPLLDADQRDELVSDGRVRGFIETARLRRAKRLIVQSGDYWTYRPGVDSAPGQEPHDYEESLYGPEIDRYENYRHDPAVNYNENAATFLPWRWIGHADINAHVIKQKFPIDAPVRDVITAFRLLVGRNQIQHIKKKRMIQFLAMLAMLGLAGLIWFVAQSGLTALSSTQMVAAASITTVIVAIIVTLGANALTKNTTSFLVSDMKSAAQTLRTALNRKNALIHASFLDALRKANNARNGYAPGDMSWIEVAVWQMRVAMWLPKRVDYIERFLQLEMQCIRFRRNFSDLVGTGLSTLIATVGALSAIAAAAAVYVTVENPWLIALAAIQSLIVIVALWAMKRDSSGHKASIQNSQIRDWIGERAWTSFSDFRMFKNIADVMQTYMHRVFTEDTKGSPTWSGQRNGD